MEQNNLNWITNFIWGIADDVLRDLYVRGKYRDVILPMTVLSRSISKRRRLNARRQSFQTMISSTCAAWPAPGLAEDVRAGGQRRVAAGSRMPGRAPFPKPPLPGVSGGAVALPAIAL